MGLYYRMDTEGDHTNLQLYSLRQAAHSWNDLVDEIGHVGEHDVSNLKERLVFILSCLGLSLSQLVGQNWPNAEKEKMANPGEILGKILKSADIKRVKCKDLNKRFQEFLNYYGAIRRFGRTKDGQVYARVDEITLSEAARFIELTIEIWDTILSIFKRDRANDLADIPLITEAVCFHRLP